MIRCMDLTEALHELLLPETAEYRNAFRLEDWNEWPERWRRAFVVVRRAALAKAGRSKRPSLLPAVLAPRPALPD